MLGVTPVVWASSVSEAPKSAAFASFGNLRGYRDFLKLEAQRPTPKSACGRKRTSTAEYEYIGTLISRESFDSVTRVETYRLRKRIGKRRRWRVCGRLNGPYNKEQPGCSMPSPRAKGSGHILRTCRSCLCGLPETF